MKIPRHGLRLTILLTPMFTAIACVPCEHPLSDEKTSVVDERLLGNWQMVDPGKPDDAPVPVAIERAKISSHVLTAATPITDETTGQPTGKVDRLEFYCTTVGHLSLISAKSSDENQPVLYDLLMYRVVNPNTVELHILDLEFITNALNRQELHGKAPKFELNLDGSNPPAKQDQRGRISSSAEELRAFIHRHGVKCFDMTPKPMTLKRRP
jgi:hypothetical protein